MSLKVIVEDTDVDAALIEGESGEPLLVLRPNMTFQNAVRAVRRAVPSLHPDQVRQLVRTYLPNATDLEAALGQVPPIPVAPPPTVVARKRPQLLWAAGAVAAVLLIFGTFGVVALANQDEHSPAVHLSAAAQATVDRDQNLFVQMGGQCHSEATMGGAVCDLPLLGRGQVEWLPGDDRVSYRMSFGDEYGVVHSFVTVAAARRFYDEDARMYQCVVRVGPWVAAGTSPVFLHELQATLENAARRLGVPAN